MNITTVCNNIELLKSKTGKLTLKVSCTDNVVKTIHSLYDPECEAKRLVDAFEFDGKGILVVLGLGLGYHLIELSRRFPEAYIIVVEAIPEIYELARKYVLAQDPELRTPNSAQFLIGLPPDKIISEITKQQVLSGMLPVKIFTLFSAVSAFSKYYQPILNTFKNTSSLGLHDKLRYPKFADCTIKILLMNFGYFLTREVENALKAFGHKVAKVHSSKEESIGNILGKTIRAILDFKPDFILTINHLGFDKEGMLTNFLSSIEMPVASWYVDSPDIIVKGFNKNVSPFVSVFLWDKNYVKNIKAMGFEHTEFLPLATDEIVFRPMRLTQMEIKKYGTDIGFVGNSMTVPVSESLEKIPERHHPLIERLSRLMSSTRMPFEEAIKKMGDDEVRAFRSLTLKERIDFEAATLWVSTMHYRPSVIKMLKEFKPRIYGDEGWRDLLDDNYTLHPKLNYYTELPLFYNACKINFNATSLQMNTPNQRVFDVLACGSFLLTDHQEVIEELFDVGKEIITYRDKDEIPELVRYYLNNPRARQEVAERGKRRVLKEHTYKHRLNLIIRSMKERYA